MNNENQTINDILAMTSKFLSKTTTETSSKKSINIKASDKENNKSWLYPTAHSKVSERLANNEKVERIVDEPPIGSGFARPFRYTGADNDDDNAVQIEDLPERVEKMSNFFIKAALMAFSYHVPLRIKPDYILYLILSGFNHWVNKKEGHVILASYKLIDPARQNICIDVPLNNPEWNDIVEILGTELQKSFLNENLINIMKASFTTTTPTMMQVKILTMASIMKEFVNIKFDTACGIPYVTLEGTQNDWEKVKVIANTLLSLANNQLDWWLCKLNTSLDIMIATSKGQGAEKDWANFFNYENTSAHTGFNGWMNSFFPYIKERGNSEITVENNDSADVYVNFDQFLESTSFEEYIWTMDHNPYKKLHVVAGIVEVIQWTGENGEDDHAVEPFMSYQITSVADERVKKRKA